MIPGKDNRYSQFRKRCHCSWVSKRRCLPRRCYDTRLELTSSLLAHLHHHHQQHHQNHHQQNHHHHHHHHHHQNHHHHHHHQNHHHHHQNHHHHHHHHHRSSTALLNHNVGHFLLDFPLSHLLWSRKPFAALLLRYELTRELRRDCTCSYVSTIYFKNELPKLGSTGI